MKTEFPDEDDLLNFTLIIEPDEGMYKGGRFNFTFAISQGFPHEAPKVLCTQKIYHPNIDLDGKVCLNILREDWKPVLNLQAVIIGLQVPNSTSPSAKALANQLYSSFFSNPTPRIHSTKKRQKIYGQIGRVSNGMFGQPWVEDLLRTRLSIGF